MAMMEMIASGPLDVESPSLARPDEAPRNLDAEMGGHPSPYVNCALTQNLGFRSKGSRCLR
eukprot:9493951-Pyramimonas_sp.AAC.1